MLLGWDARLLLGLRALLLLLLLLLLEAGVAAGAKTAAEAKTAAGAKTAAEGGVFQLCRSPLVVGECHGGHSEITGILWSVVEG